MAAFPVHEATPYFINGTYGFVFTPGLHTPGSDLPIDPIALWRTTDGGYTWQPIDLGTNGVADIWQLCFVTPSHGYMAGDAVGVSAMSMARGCSKRLDSGTNCSYVKTHNITFTSTNHFIWIYAVDSVLYAITTPSDPYFNSQVMLWMSSDAGYTWRNGFECSMARIGYG